jgi:hypothetical protein
MNWNWVKSAIKTVETDSDSVSNFVEIANVKIGGGGQVG